MTSSEWLRCTLCLLLLVHLCDGASMSLRGVGAAVPGDPAPRRSPGPPQQPLPPPPLVGLTSDSAKHGLVDQHQQLTIVMTADTVDAGGPCDLDGDLIVVDADKAAVNINISHDLFQTHVLTHDVQYRVSIQKRAGDNKHVQGFSLHTLGDGEPKGVFTSSAAIANCMKSSIKGQLDESSSNSQVMYNWTLPLEQPTRSNITFRLRYKIQASSSVFQVNYAFAISQGCQIWLRRDAANISSIDFPRTLQCQVYFPGHRNGDGLVLELTRLNVPCAGGGFLQFSGTGNHSQYHRQAVLCGKLEELADTDRQLYFPDLRNQAPLLHLYGHPVFSLHYRLVDHCYNVTFVTRNGSFELRPTGNLQCTFKIYLPYGNRVVLKLEIGDESAPAPAPVTSASVAVTEEEPTLACQQDGLFTELWDGSTSWTHCARHGDLYRRTEIVSRDNRVLMKVSARGYRRQPYTLVLRFQYYAESVPSIVQQCSFGWVAVRQFCVTAVENVRLPWPQAELECNRRGGHLASIRTEQAQSIIDQLLMNSAGYRDQNAYWLGASDKTYEGDFRWTDGLPFSYTNWFPGWSQYDHYNRQPNDDGLSDQDCIEVRRLYHLPTASVRLASSFMWNDRDCTTANYFLCERLVADEPMEDGWPPECNRTVTLSREQQRASVSSPGFPRQYPDNADCDTEIFAPAAYRIVMDFEELVLEKEPLCSYDYLEIIEMATDGHSGNVSRRLCGDWSAKLKLLRYVSTGSRLRLRFVSDYSHHYGGFKARMSMENAMQCADDRLVIFNSSCYLFVSYPEVTWSTAQQICKGMRAHLASVQSPEEERFVTSNIRRTAEYRTSAVYWLGSRMSPENGTYQWLDGTTMSYTAWLPGQNPTEQNHSQQQQQQQRELLVKYETPMCLGIQWTSSPTPMLPSGLYWRSKRCSAVGGYVCKRRNQISGSELNFNRTVNGTEGRLTSPNYPGNYYSNLDFLVKIIGPERTRLIIQFSKLDLEPQLECLYDYIELRSVIRGNADALNDAMKWCGNHDTDMERFDFVSETNEAELRFHSDYSISGSGFSVTWHAVDVSSCPLQTLTAREGVVTSPNYPHFLLARLDCAITILAPAGKRIWLEITDYDMDGSGWYELGQSQPTVDRARTSEAVLELDLGGSSTVFRPFQVSGQLTDGAFVSTGERLQVRLRTADRPLGAGFRAQYKTVNGIQEERIIDLGNVTSGSLLHLNYPNPPPTHIDFLQHLIAPLGHIILLELYNMKFSEHGCRRNEASIDVLDNYADSNGTSWHLCYSGPGDDTVEMDGSGGLAAPLAITSYLNTLHVRQRSRTLGIPLNGSVRVRADVNYKIKLLRQEESVVESCSPNPCQNMGKCMTNGGRKFCQCVGHFTGLFCALTMCELEPCVFGQCTLTAASFRCHCQTGYTGGTCEQKQRPCEGNPCEGRGECIERADTYHCRCHAWWEGARCERRMMHIPYTPLSERMLHEPFWLGLITVTIVLAVIGLVWCARRHFPEKLEKLLAEESDRNRCSGTSLRGGSSVREQLSGGAAATAAVMVVPSPQPGCQRSLFGRLGIRKPSILSLTSPHGLNVNNHATAAAAARTFSLDDLLKPPPRRTPSPRKKRNNSTPTKKNAAEKKQILQQLISPSNQQRARNVSIGELIQLSERKLKEQGNSSEMANDIKETHLGENNVTSTAQITLTDPKLEKKVTFARLLNKVSQEMSSGSEVELGVLHTTNHQHHQQQQQHSSGRTSTGAVTTTLRSASTPPSPATDMRSPNSTSSNQGSDSLSSSDLALATPSDLFGRKTGGGKFQMGRNKPASADSILAMFRNFSSTSVPMNMAASIRVSPSSTPTASTPQDDVAGDDESTTSSIHTPVSLDSPPIHRRHLLQSQHNHSTIEVPVLDALSAHKCNDAGSNFLHPPTILLEVPTTNTSINKCLSPIREMPTPLPTPLPSPCLTPVLQRSAASSSAEDLGMDLSDDRISVELPCMSAGYSDDDDDDNNNNNDDDEDLVHSVQDIAIDIQAEDGLIQEEAAVMQQTCSHATYKYKTRPPLHGQTATVVDSTASSSSSSFSVVPGDKLVGGERDDDTVTNCLSQPAPPTSVVPVQVPLVIPMLTIQQPSPTHTRPHLLTLPGSPPPHRSPVGIQECSNFYHHHHHHQHHPTVMYGGDKSSRRMLKDFDKPTSLDLPCAPPLITVTCNMSEAESDAESLSPLATKPCNPHVGSTSGTVAMCYLSPFSMCSRADRTASESNLSSSGYSSMASPGPSRCGSNNPLCPSEMEDPGAPGPNSTAATSLHHSQLPRRPSPLLKSNPSSAGGNTVDNDAGEQRGGHCRGRSDSETLSDDPMLESNDEGIGTDHIDEKIEEGELKSAKELEMYIGKDLTVLEDPLDALHIDRLLFPSAVAAAAAPIATTAVVPVSSPVCKVSLLQLPSIVIEADPCDSGSISVGSTLVGSLQQQQQQQQHVSPVSSRSESPLSDRTVGIGGCAASGIGAVALGRFSPHFYNKHKDLLPFTDSDGLYDFPSSDCTPQNKVSVVSTMQQHRKSTGRKREKKSTRNALKSQSPTKSLVVATGTGSLHHQHHHHHHHLDVPSGKESYYRVQTPRKPSPKRRARKEQILSSSSSSESLSSIREPKLSSSSPSPDTIRWPAPGPLVSSGNSTSTSASVSACAGAGASTVPPTNAKWLDVSGSRRPTVLVHESSCEEDSADESFSVQSPSVADDATNKQTRKISRLRTISHQIRFLRRLEKNLKRREHVTCPSDSIDSGDGEEYCRVTSPLLQPELGVRPQIRKSISIGLLPSGGSTSNPSTRFKRGKMKKGSDLLIPQEDITWTHVLTTVCVPTANYEHRLQYGCPMKSDESADDGENLIKLDIELRNKNSIQNVVSKIGDHYKQYGTSSANGQGQEPNIRKYIPMEKILDELLTKLNIEHVVWCGDKNANYYEVFFPLASGEPCENCLHCLTEIGIGVKWNSLVSVLPCSVVYSGVTHDQTKHNDDLTPEESSAWSNFVDSVKSKLTVKQVVNGVESGGDLTFDYIMLILTADCLAALGLVENNAPNIVAAMLVSPLMGPVMSVTFGTIIADRRLQRTGFITLATGIVISIVFGFIFGLLLGTTDMPWGFGDWPTEEMKARGNARCLWIGVLWALPSGTGVALALLQGSAGPLIGVAISASLLPPVVNCGLFWALACIWLARDNVKMPHMAGESYTGNSSYVPIYAEYMPTEFFINGLISGLLTVVNVVFIFVSAIVMLKIKEVAAPYTSTPDVRRFWERDIRLVRENNQSMHRSSKQDSSATAQELTDERLDSVLEAAVRVAQDDDTLDKVRRISYTQQQQQTRASSSDELRMSMVTELNTLDHHIAALLATVTPHSSPAPSRYQSFRRASSRYRRSANVVLPTILETAGNRSRSALSRTISLEPPRIVSSDAVAASNQPCREH